MVCGQLQAVPAQLAGMASGNRHGAAAGTGADDPGGSNDVWSSYRASNKSQRLGNLGNSSSDDHDDGRQGRGIRKKGYDVSYMSSSSTTSGDVDRGIVNRINAIKKGRRLSGFGTATDDKK